MKNNKKNIYKINNIKKIFFLLLKFIFIIVKRDFYVQ